MLRRQRELERPPPLRPREIEHALMDVRLFVFSLHVTPAPTLLALFPDRDVLLAATRVIPIYPSPHRRYVDEEGPYVI